MCVARARSSTRAGRFFRAYCTYSIPARSCLHVQEIQRKMSLKADHFKLYFVEKSCKFQTLIFYTYQISNISILYVFKVSYYIHETVNVEMQVFSILIEILNLFAPLLPDSDRTNARLQYRYHSTYRQAYKLINQHQLGYLLLFTYVVPLEGKGVSSVPNPGLYLASLHRMHQQSIFLKQGLYEREFVNTYLQLKFEYEKTKLYFLTSVSKQLGCLNINLPTVEDLRKLLLQNIYKKCYCRKLAWT